MIVKKILTESTSWLLDRLFGPVKSGPDGAGDVVAIDAPFVGDGTHDVQAVVSGGIDHGLVPGPAVVLNFDSGMKIWKCDNSDGEGASGETRAAVLSGVGCEFRGAENDVVGSRAIIQDCTQVGPYGTDVLGGAGISGLDRVLPESSGCWGLHGSSLRLVRDLCMHERTLSY
jgi:hypothetical protein